MLRRTCRTCASPTTGERTPRRTRSILPEAAGVHTAAWRLNGAHSPGLARDCGLACVLMALGGLGAKLCDLRVMRRLCPTTSIWTVDLAHLLRRFGVDVTFCTITLGANPDFASEARGVCPGKALDVPRRSLADAR